MLVGLSAESGPLFKARSVLIIKILMKINTLWALHNKILFGFIFRKVPWQINMFRKSWEMYFHIHLKSLKSVFVPMDDVDELSIQVHVCRQCLQHGSKSDDKLPAKCQKGDKELNFSLHGDMAF